MADQKLSMLFSSDPAADFDGEEIIEVTQSGATKGGKLKQFVDNDPTLAGDSANKPPSQQAVKAFVEDSIAAATATPFAQLMLSDMSTDLTTGTNKGVWFAPENGQLAEVWLALHDPSSSGVVRIDMNDSGGSVFTTRPSIDATEATSLAGTAAVLDGTITFSKGDKFTFDIDDAGTDAKGLQVTVGYTPL